MSDKTKTATSTGKTVDWKSKYENKVKDCDKLIKGMQNLQYLLKRLQQENEKLTAKLEKYKKQESSNTKNSESNKDVSQNISKTKESEEKLDEKAQVDSVGEETSKEKQKKEKDNSKDTITTKKQQNGDKLKNVSADVKEIKKPHGYVAIVGAGERGRYLAIALKCSGNYNVILVDTNRDILKIAQMSIKANIPKNMKNESKIIYLSDLATMVKYRVLFVIETICERIDLKKHCIRDIFSRLLLKAKQDATAVDTNTTDDSKDSEVNDNKAKATSTSTSAPKNKSKNNKAEDVKKPKNKQQHQQQQRKIKLNCVICTVSSMWSVSEIASVLPNEYQGNVIGLSLTNNIHDKSKFIEMRPAWQSSRLTIDYTKKLIESIGMSSISTADSPGLIKFRLLAVYINEAFCLLQEKVSSAVEIDRIMSQAMNNGGVKNSHGNNMGPLAIADAIGLDKVLGMLNILHTEFGDAKYCPNFMLKQYVRCGRLGRKTKIGVFLHK